MKNLFIALIGLFVFIGCSKSFKEVDGKSTQSSPLNSQ